MKNTLVRPANSIESIIHKYGNMLFRLCLITLGNPSDAEDVVQETMIKYLQKAPEFENEEHEKAWMIKVAANKCKDLLRYKKNHPVIDMEEIMEYFRTAVNCLPFCLQYFPAPKLAVENPSSSELFPRSGKTF